jgi:hypothetical protein
MYLSILHLQPQATAHGPRPLPVHPPPWVRPWVSLTLTLLTSESKSKSRDVETRQSRPSLAELSWFTCPLILFNFIAGLLGSWLMSPLFLRPCPSHTCTLIGILPVLSSSKSGPTS